MEEGSRLGPYELIKRIGMGGMAEIYLARTTGIGGFEKYLALKVIHPKYAEDQEFIDMLIDEAKIVVQLNHVNVGQIFDLGCIDDAYYIAMEFVDGRDLYQLLVKCADDDVAIPFDLIAFVAKEAAAALQYAHTKTDRYGRPLNLIHRDVSPQNILLSFDGQVKLVDFGIAKANQRRQQTESGVIKGKFFYMSPEQAWGDPLDPRSDVFSCGICLYEMITGEMLYNEERALVLLDKVRKAIIPDIRSIRPDVPPQLEAIVMKALARDREDRYPSAGALQAALSSFLYSHWPSFSQNRLGGFLQEHFDAHASLEALPAASPEPPTVPSPTMGDEPLMGPDDFDRTYGQSVIFALGDAELDSDPDEPVSSRPEIDYDEGDVTMASTYNVDDLLKPIEESSPSWGESGEHTELLDNSLFRDDSPLPATSEITGSMESSQDMTSVFSAHELAEPKRVKAVASPPSAPTARRTTPDVAPAQDRPSLSAQSFITPERPSDSEPARLQTQADAPRAETFDSLRTIDELKVPGLPNMDGSDGGPALDTTETPRQLPKQRTPNPLPRRTSEAAEVDLQDSSFLARLIKKALSPGGVTVIAFLGFLTYAALEYIPALMDPPSTEAILVIGSVPPGASIEIDGKKSGQKTPARITGFQVGQQHEVKIVRKGYRTQTEKVEMQGMVNPDGIVEVRRQFFLHRALGTLEVVSNPPKAEVYLDGRYIGETPLVKRNLARKKKKTSVLIRKNGFLEKREVLNWGSRVSVRLEVNLSSR